MHTDTPRDIIFTITRDFPLKRNTRTGTAMSGSSTLTRTGPTCTIDTGTEGDLPDML